ncbi:hypothetical protein, partial [Arhodomonas sp. KWT]
MSQFGQRTRSEGNRSAGRERQGRTPLRIALATLLLGSTLPGAASAAAVQAEYWYGIDGGGYIST